MNIYKANLINAFSWIILGLIAYLTSETPSYTALIPVLAGVILLILSPGIKKSNKNQAHVAVIITFIVLLAFIFPLKGTIHRGDNIGLVRVIVMITTSVLAMVYFVKSFIDARRNRKLAS